MALALSALLVAAPLVASSATPSGSSLEKKSFDWPWDLDLGLGLLGQKLTPEAYEKSVKLDGLLTHSKALAGFAAAHGNTRSFGTLGYNKSADYVYNLAKRAGYDVYRQPNVYPASDIHSTGLIVNGQNITGHTAFQYSGATSKEGVTAAVTVVPNLGCVASEWEGTAGKIALVERGNCTFVEKADFGYRNKVAGVIIYNNVAGPPVASRINNTFATNPPVLSLNRDSGLAIKNLASSGQAVEATLFIDLTNEYRTAENVVAQTKWGDKNNVVFIGAHLDSVPAGPGINDDGSGTATVAELAIQLSKFKKSKNAVRFAWWSTEEVGLIGSRYYVDHLPQAERDKIALYINLDMTASPNYILGVYDADNSAGGNTGIPAPAGSGALEKLFQNDLVNRGLNHTAYAFTAGSDYRPFLDVGIPAGGIATGAGGIKTQQEVALFGGEAGIAYDVCYHQLCDNLDNLNHVAYLAIAKSTANVVAQLAADTSVIEKEQTLYGRGMNIPRQIRAEKEILTHLGKECTDVHEEL